ncbi:hypothetical protein DPMN_115450 [Dreissena polymorpha]|uniref:Uncharacterized protein n=1 Tax=Dreissena polymorpha TaxID=45954 RepID=A0A9D4KMG6_DREPO|nr:hypothetical protein DPMN_115449 [Dreissena polymorpha]KAH3841963.1 hypothetical protein DPMN_115450 [Dreissena polymorpha]
MTTPTPVASGACQGAKLGQGSPVAKAVILPSNSMIFLNAPASPLGTWPMGNPAMSHYLKKRLWSVTFCLISGGKSSIGGIHTNAAFSSCKFVYSKSTFNSVCIGGLILNW